MDEALLREISLPHRSGTDCAKWDGLQETFHQEGLLPLWVADMDFKAPLCVRAALHQAVDQGAFGYYQVPDRYYDSIISWELRRHNHRLEKDWLRATPGVVTGLYHLISAITQPGDGVMIQTPVYYPFYRVIGQTGRRAVYQPLLCDKGVYTIDQDAFERTIVEEKVTVFLLCSPHNPVGRVWTREELSRMLDTCRRHGVQVVADEIHHDLIMPGHTHIPAATLWEGEGAPITFFSASKTFNLAGMKNSVLVIPQKDLRDRYDAFEQALGTGLGSTMDFIAVTAAFEGGEPWLDTVLEEIWGNYHRMKEALSRFEDITVSPLEGTYLLWIDLGSRVDRKDLHSFIQDRCAIAPDYGHWFFPEKEKAGDCHIRLNLAAPRATIEQAARQLVNALENVRS